MVVFDSKSLKHDSHDSINFSSIPCFQVWWTDVDYRRRYGSEWLYSCRRPVVCFGSESLPPRELTARWISHHGFPVASHQRSLRTLVVCHRMILVEKTSSFHMSSRSHQIGSVVNLWWFSPIGSSSHSIMDSHRFKRHQLADTWGNWSSYACHYDNAAPGICCS